MADKTHHVCPYCGRWTNKSAACTMCRDWGKEGWRLMQESAACDKECEALERAIVLAQAEEDTAHVLELRSRIDAIRTKALGYRRQAREVKAGVELRNDGW